MNTRTKLICTIGPACKTIEMMVAMIEAGMNVARLNFSHGTHEEHLVAINNLKEARKRTNRPLAIMLDTKGPEIRLGKIQESPLFLSPGHKWLLVKDVVPGDMQKVTVVPGSVLDNVAMGTRILFDDGYISSRVVEITQEGVYVEVENGGLINGGKGVNIPDTCVNLPAVTERDIEDIRFGCLHDVDLIAASFVRSPDHVLEIKKLLEEQKKSDILIIAKIENSEGVQNFDSIIQVADGVMIARGDLGVEVPISQVPGLQKMMIRKCYNAGKPSVTATQMLESMIYNPRPTRAEASDVANAIYDSTSAVMLSGETAVGKYPLETVKMMKSIVSEAEKDFNYRQFFDQHSRLIFNDVPSAVTLATVKTAYSSNAKAIFAFTNRGSTARLISRLRPSMSLLAMTPQEKCYNQMAFNWGVIPILEKECRTLPEAFNKASTYALERGFVEYGDLVVVTAGSPFGISGTTNMMIVESIGEVLVRGTSGLGSKVHGNVMLLLQPEVTKFYTARGQILVISRCDEQFAPHIRECVGVILQNDINDNESVTHMIEIANRYGKPFILRADGAMRILKGGQLVTLDPEKALVYKGVVL